MTHYFYKKELNSGRSLKGFFNNAKFPIEVAQLL